jgi:two-component system sensor histidine kinase/response regulator
VHETVNILLVDNEPGGLLALEAILEPLGQKLITARSGQEALRQLLAHDFALILLDIQMPELDGFQTAALIRERERSRHTPIIFLTASYESEVQVFRGYAVGAVDYVFKPLQPEILRSKVSVFVELARTTEVVRKQAVQLEAANKDLESFSYSVSHDLRAPLRAIDGYTNILRERYGDKLGDENSRVLGKIIENTQRMETLIKDLLAFSQLGRRPISAAEIDMDALAREVIDELRSTPGQRVPQCVLKPLPVGWGDRSLIRQVWFNLLSNAIKFTGTKEVPSIELGGSSEDTRNVYYVKDNGAGFDMRYYDKLFGVFQRLHSAREFPGTGVGLAIVQRVVARHGGRAWAEGKLGEGATFYFALPKKGLVSELSSGSGEKKISPQ